MEPPVLLDKTQPPSRETLVSILQSSYDGFAALEEAVDGLQTEWKFYGAKYGWIFKATDRKKSLFWLTPLPGKFRLGFSLREAEWVTLAQRRWPAELSSAIRSAERFPEGFGFRWTVQSDRTLKAAVKLVRLLREMRET